MNVDLRDYFATKAMQTFLNKPLPEGHSWNFENISRSAYDAADAMLKARQECSQTVN